MGQPIVDLDGLIDDLVVANVNVVGAQQAVVDAQTISDGVDVTAAEVVATKDAVDITKTEVDMVKTEVDDVAAAVAQDKIDVAALADEVFDDKELTKDYRIEAELYRDGALSYLQATGVKYDQFDDRYLGALGTAPLVDNDGDPIQEGATYWNMGTKTMYVWDGTRWDSYANVALAPEYEFSIDGSGNLVMTLVEQVEPGEYIEWSSI